MFSKPLQIVKIEWISSFEERITSLRMHIRFSYFLLADQANPFSTGVPGFTIHCSLHFGARPGHSKCVDTLVDSWFMLKPFQTMELAIGSIMKEIF